MWFSWRIFAMHGLGVRGKLLLAVVAFNLLLGAGAYWYVTRLAADQAEQTAHLEAKRLEAQLREVRAYYTTHVVATAARQKVEASHDYAQKPAAIPLPATMIHEMNDSLSKKEGYTIRLYSK